MVGGGTILVNTFTSYPSAYGRFNASGEQTIYVGATRADQC